MFRRPSKKEVAEKPIEKCSFCKKNEMIGKVRGISYCGDSICANKFWDKEIRDKAKIVVDDFGEITNNKIKKKKKTDNTNAKDEYKERFKIKKNNSIKCYVCELVKSKIEYYRDLEKRRLKQYSTICKQCMLNIKKLYKY